MILENSIKEDEFQQVWRVQNADDIIWNSNSFNVKCVLRKNHLLSLQRRNVGIIENNFSSISAHQNSLPPFITNPRFAGRSNKRLQISQLCRLMSAEPVRKHHLVVVEFYSKVCRCRISVDEVTNFWKHTSFQIIATSLSLFRPLFFLSLSLYQFLSIFVPFW